MKHTKTHQKELFIAFGAVLTMALFVSLYNYISTNNSGGLHSAAPSESQTGNSTKTLIERRAQRLQQRLARSGEHLPEGILEAALTDRQKMLKRTVSVHVEDSISGKSVDWTFSPTAHPGLLVLENDWTGTRFTIDEESLKDYIETSPASEMQALVIPRVTKIESDGYILRANANAIAKSGFEYDASDLANKLSDALKYGTEKILLNLPYKEAHVELRTGSGKQTLSLLATGISDYSNSPEERVWNVHKAIDERVNNTAVAPNGVFSFVSTLGGPVTLQKGWKEGLGLFGGGTADTPGAGICQAATTVFRAALLAGFPLVERRNHSMFVDHYEPYGVGLDATIFPGVHDMRFLNDTASHLVIQSYTVGDDVFVNVFGIPDGRKVELDGPYFASTKPRAKELRALSHEEIGWVRHVTYSNGEVHTKPLVARYHKGFLRAVVNKYAGTPGMELLYTLDYKGATHAAAPQQ